MKNIKLYIFLLFTSCNIVPPTISWEDLNEDYEPQLNILGVITSSTNDSLNTSFIKVHRSLKVDEARDSLIRYIDENEESRVVYESRYIVKDAEVILSNSDKDYKFNFYEEKYIGSDSILYKNSYFYDGFDFVPKPEELWDLTVSTSSGLLATGKTIIPPNPIIYTENLPDTFNIIENIYFELLPMKENNQILNISNFLSYTGLSFFYGIDEEDTCGFTKEFLIKDEVKIEYDLGSCKYLLNDEWPNDDFLMINLMSLDSNYYNYFIDENNQDNEFSNLIIGEGGVPKAYGLQNAIGVFGSIAFDKHYIKIR